MSGRRSGGEDDDCKESFADAMDDVAPIRDRDKLRRPPEPPPRVPLRVPARGPARGRSFVVERSGGDVFARAEDVSRRRLSELRAGRPPAERELDLHGLRADAARRVLHDALEDAQRGGVRCLLVIHGEGHRSASGPVLKPKLADWLQEPPVAGAVMAFATAPRRPGGGPGATLVLLRRRR